MRWNSTILLQIVWDSLNIILLCMQAVHNCVLETIFRMSQIIWKSTTNCDPSHSFCLYSLIFRIAYTFSYTITKPVYLHQNCVHQTSVYQKWSDQCTPDQSIPDMTRPVFGNPIFIKGRRTNITYIIIHLQYVIISNQARTEHFFCAK